VSRSNRRSRTARTWAQANDYGAYAGMGSSHFTRGRLIVDGVRPGRDAEFMAALVGMDDAGSRRLRDKAQASPAEWNRELRTWVRKRMERGIDVPDSIAWRRKRA
jgi:hypothetical protein